MFQLSAACIIPDGQFKRRHGNISKHKEQMFQKKSYIFERVINSY